jgi:ribosomal protein L11 methylase PrmA
MNSPEASDKRTLAYGRLHANQLHDELKWNEYSSRRILELVFGYYRPNSLLDVGCGLGTWLKMATTLGVTDVMGVDGEWIDPAKLEVTAK